MRILKKILLNLFCNFFEEKDIYTDFYLLNLNKKDEDIIFINNSILKLSYLFNWWLQMLN